MSTTRLSAFKTGLIIGASLAALCAHSGIVRAQQQDNLDLGVVLTTQGANTPVGTLTGVPTPNTGNNGATCTYSQISSSGSPSVTFSIQFEDTVSGNWQNLVTSAAITNYTTPQSLMVYPGATATSVPSGLAIAGLKLPRTWRVSATVTGANTGANYQIGCTLLK